MDTSTATQISDLARELVPEVTERFLRYVRIDTQARPGVDRVPSTEKQLDLSRLLVDELNDLGASEVDIDAHGIVFATIPATSDADIPTVGFVAHVDTSPDAPGSGVTPQLIRYQGGPVALPGSPDLAIDPAESPGLTDHIGHEIVTTDGTTLLGADDKAGVAAIMTAASYLMAHRERSHGRVRIAFTTDEEVGNGARYFDIERFGARCAYTIDGSTAGDIEDETFSAGSVEVTFHGFNIHPGFGFERLVNAIKLATDFVAMLPAEDAPERTQGRQGYIHPVSIEGSVDSATVHLIVRDFETDEVKRRIELLRELADRVVAGTGVARVGFKESDDYRNMKEHLDDAPEVVEAAVEAIRRTGLEPRRGYIRGGTDGSILTAKGLPTPNIFSGAHDFHSVKEWVCVYDMAAAAATVINVAEVWSELEGGRSN